MSVTLPESAAHPALSRREYEVLWSLGLGLTDKEVAAKIGVSLGTVRVYRKRLQAKLGTDRLVQSILIAGRYGMIDLEALTEAILDEQDRGRPRRVVLQAD